MTLTTHDHSHTSQTQVCKKRFTLRGILFFTGWSKKTPAQFLTDLVPESQNGPLAPLGPHTPQLLFSLVVLTSKSFPNTLSKVLQKDSVSTRWHWHLVCQYRSVLHTYHNVGLVHGPEHWQKPFQRDQDQIHPAISPSSTLARSQDWGQAGATAHIESAVSLLTAFLGRFAFPSVNQW